MKDENAYRRQGILIQVFLGIHRHAVQPYFIMEMRSSARPGIAYIGYDISSFDLLPHFHIEPGVVPENSLDSVPMADFNHIAVSGAEAGLEHNAIGRRYDRRSCLCCDI